MSVAMRLGLGPQRQRGEGEQAGAGADVGDVGEVRAVAFQPVERREAAGGGRVLAGAEGEAGVDLEADRARRPARGAVGVWTKKRPARIGSQARLAHRHPVVLAELLDRRRRRRPSVASASQIRPSRAGGRNKRGSASRRAWPGRARRRPAPAGRRARGNRSSASGSASAWARVQARVTRQLIWPRFLGQPLVEPLRQRRRHSRGSHRGFDQAARLPAMRSVMSLADGCGVSRMSQSSAGDLGDRGAEGGDVGGMVAEAVVVAADRRTGCRRRRSPAHAAVAAAPAPAERARRVAGRGDRGQHRSPSRTSRRPR